MSLREEIYEQPKVLKRWLETQMDPVQRIAGAIRSREIEFVFLAARGTSDHAGVYGQYLWGSLNHWPVAFAAPSLFTLYGGWPKLSKALVIGVSQSGQSPDVVSVLAEGRKQGALTLAITNAPESPLARAAEYHLDVHAGPEKAVAATKSYTAELLAIAALSASLSLDQPHIKSLWKLPQLVEQALQLEGRAEALAHELKDMSRCVVLGRGYNYASAMEWSLKLKELAYVFADPYSSADFQHGPIAIVEPGFNVLTLAPSGVVLPDLLTMMQRLREQGARLLVMSDDMQALALGHDVLALPKGVPEWLSPIVSIVPAQLFAYHLTRAKGLNTESPRGLRKVTLTR
jgi:glucosamine--fructose-6-phosphate aminotransferase (isomerizing)